MNGPPIPTFRVVRKLEKLFEIENPELFRSPPATSQVNASTNATGAATGTQTPAIPDTAVSKTQDSDNAYTPAPPQTSRGATPAEPQANGAAIQTSKRVAPEIGAGAGPVSAARLEQRVGSHGSANTDDAKGLDRRVSQEPAKVKTASLLEGTNVYTQENLRPSGYKEQKRESDSNSRKAGHRANSSNSSKEVPAKSTATRTSQNTTNSIPEDDSRPSITENSAVFSQKNGSIRSDGTTERMALREPPPVSVEPKNQFLRKVVKKSSLAVISRVVKKASFQNAPSNQTPIFNDIDSLAKAGIVIPNPCQKPLNQRLAPRNEFAREWRPPPKLGLDSSTPSPAASRSQKIESVRKSGSLPSEGSRDNPFQKEISHKTESSGADPYFNSTRKRNSLHILAVADFLAHGRKNHLEPWANYLTQYCKGVYNLTTPPIPEMFDSSFEYLPAVFPTDEIKRMSLWRQFEVLWPTYGVAGAAPLAKEAANYFGVAFVTISFFDESKELRKVKWGELPEISGRDISLAAHSLYSMDGIVILDTKQDWRFRNNPLVAGTHNIQFFAAAAMVANDHIIGAFTILDKKPQTEFGYTERRKLTEYADKTMKGMVKRYEWMTRPDDCMRETPILDRDSLVFGDYGDYYPQKTDFHPKVIVPSRDSSLNTVIVRSQPIDARFRNVEQTPPSSSEDNKLFGATSSSLSPALPPPRYSYNNSPPARQYSPASDLTSVNEVPSPTPLDRGSISLEFQFGREPSVASFMSLEDRDLYEPEDSEFGEEQYEGTSRRIYEEFDDSFEAASGVYPQDTPKHYPQKQEFYSSDEEFESAGRYPEEQDSAAGSSQIPEDGYSQSGEFTEDEARLDNYGYNSDEYEYDPNRHSTIPEYFETQSLVTHYTPNFDATPSGPPPSIPPPPIPACVRPILSKLSPDIIEQNTNQAHRDREAVEDEEVEEGEELKKMGDGQEVEKTDGQDQQRILQLKESCSTITTLRTQQSGVFRDTTTSDHQVVSPSEHDEEFIAATAACEELCDSLGYDLIYIVELRSTTCRPLAEEEILLPGMLRTKVLALFPPSKSGLSMAPEHLIDTLRKTVSIFVKNECAPSRPGSLASIASELEQYNPLNPDAGDFKSAPYELGVLLALGELKLSDTRFEGAVLAAFRSEGENYSEEEKAGLIKMLKIGSKRLGLEDMVARREERAKITKIQPEPRRFTITAETRATTRPAPTQQQAVTRPGTPQPQSQTVTRHAPIEQPVQTATRPILNQRLAQAVYPQPGNFPAQLTQSVRMVHWDQGNIMGQVQDILHGAGISMEALMSQYSQPPQRTQRQRHHQQTHFPPPNYAPDRPTITTSRQTHPDSQQHYTARYSQVSGRRNHQKAPSSSSHGHNNSIYEESLDEYEFEADERTRQRESGYSYSFQEDDEYEDQQYESEADSQGTIEADNEADYARRPVGGSGRFGRP